MTNEIAIHKAGNPQALRDWYNAGADGQINWGQPGDFEDCVAIAGQHIDNPEGFCQLRHIDATGEPAGKASGEIAKADEPDYTKLISDRKGEPDDQDLYNKVISEAKSKFDVYPSAVANGWVVQEYKRRGGTYHKPVTKGDKPGHEFHGNQYTSALKGAGIDPKEAVTDKTDIHGVLDKMTNAEIGKGYGYLGERGNYLRSNGISGADRIKLADKLIQATAIKNGWNHHDLATFVDSKNGRHFGDVMFGQSEAGALEEGQRFLDREIVGMGLKKSAPFSGDLPNQPNPRTATYIAQAKALSAQGDGLRRLEKWQSASFTHSDAADAYRKAAQGETGGNADVLNAHANAQDQLAKYCSFLDNNTEQHSPAEMAKANGAVPAYPGTQYQNPPFQQGAQDWGWLGEGQSTHTPEYNPNPTGTDLVPDDTSDSSAEPHSDWTSEDAQ